MQDGVTLSKESHKVCKILNIDPETLKTKSVDDFKAEGLEDHIAKIRYEHHSDQREKKIRMIENFLMSGMLQTLT